MRSVSALIPVLLAAALAGADRMGSTPLLGQIGGTYLSNDLREFTGLDWGYSAGVTTLLAEQGAIGMPSADINVRYAPGSDGTLVTFETCYAERTLVGDRTLLGLGFGANFVRLRRHEQDINGTTVPVDDHRRWSVGGKATMMYMFSDRVFLEATYHYTGKVQGVDTSSLSLCLGYWF